jgi:hypothetical protein
VYYKEATRALGALAGYAPGSATITVGYATRGTSDDWMYAFGRGGDGHIFSWTPESGNGEDGFWPLPSRIVPISAWDHRMNLGIAWAAGAAPMITARSWRTGPDGPVVRLRIINAGRAAMSSAGTVALDGGEPIAVPSLAPAEALTLELPVPPSIVAAAAPRPRLGIALGYDGATIHDSIAPIVHAVDTLFSDDFESGVGRWNPTIAWGMEETVDHTRVASDSPGGLYVERPGVNELILGEPVSLERYAAADLTFDASFAVEGHNHDASVQVRRDSSLIWEDVECDELQLPYASASTYRNHFRGDMREWRRYHVRLDAFAGERVTIRFALQAVTSPWHYTFDGLKIDNVAIVAARGSSAAIDGDAARVASTIAVGPNPFSTHLTVRLAERAAGGGAEARVELYDALGNRVRSLQARSPATIDTAELPPGLYVIVVTDGDVVARRALVRR